MQHWQQYIELVQQQVVPALGCTEPVSVALASAKATELLQAQPDYLQVQVSPNLYKNGMGVYIPGTGQTGLAMAAALGATGGKANLGLQVLAAISPSALAQAKRLIKQNKVSLKICASDDVLFTVVTAGHKGREVEVCIAGAHTRFEYIKQQGKLVYQAEPLSTASQQSAMPDLNLADILQFVQQVPLAQIAFIAEAAKLNGQLAQVGLSGNYGLALGASLQAQVAQGLLSDDLMTKAMSLGAAASDARMGGAALAAMSNSGSGNQGIAATMPILAYGELTDLSEEQQLRALMLSHLVAIYVKAQQNKLSALCAATTASMGACAALTWLMGGDLAAIHRAINAMVADVSGVFCDGAKAGCAMKVSTGASSAVKSAILAIAGHGVSAQQGIVFESADTSIAQLGQLSKTAMLATDQAIIATMQAKQQQC